MRIERKTSDTDVMTYYKMSILSAAPSLVFSIILVKFIGATICIG